MTTVFLVRHCAIDTHGHSIAGRSPGVHLSALGRAQAQRLAAQSWILKVDAIYSSPLERARETAAAFASCAPGPVRIVDALTEVDFGDWTGMTFDALEKDDRWKNFNTRRSETRIPGGELMGEAQQRAVSFLDSVRSELPGGKVIAVGHGDVLRSVVAWHLRLPLDDMLRFEISPGGISVVQLFENWSRVLCVNAQHLSGVNSIVG